MTPKYVVVICYKDNYGTESVVERALSSAGIAHSCIDREKLNTDELGKADLVITVGGDGTFLRTSQHVKNQLMLSVVPNVKKSEAYFARAAKHDFRKKLSLILEDKHKVIALNRLESVITSKGSIVKPELAVNEIFVGSKYSYLTFRYSLKIGKIREFQKSSGVIVSTGAGSHAWLGSAGGKRMPLNSKKIQYVIREPFFGRLTKPKLTEGLLSENAKVIIKSMDWQGIVVIDSHHKEYEFNDGSSVAIGNSKQPLRFVSF